MLSISTAGRSAGRRIIYDGKAVARLAVIRVAKDAGFSIAEIRQLVQEFTGLRWGRLAERKLREIDAAASRLRLMKKVLRAMMDCGCFEIDACGSLLRAETRRERLRQ